MSNPKELSEEIIANINEWDESDVSLYDQVNAVEKAINDAKACIEFSVATLEEAKSNLTNAKEAHNTNTTINYQNVHEAATEVAGIEGPGPEPDPHPEPSEIVWGYTAYRTNLSTTLSDGVEPPTVYRIFDGDKNLSFSRSQYEQAPVMWVSWKADQFRPQDWGKQVIDHARSNVPKTTKVLITAHHEPENNAAGGQSLSQWSKAYREGITEITKACEQLRSEGWDIWSAPIVCDWVFQPWGDKADIDLWYPNDGSIKMDLMGFDSYPQGQNASGKGNIARLRMEADYKPAPYEDPNRFDCYMSFRRTADWAAKFNVPWGIAEIGMVRGDFDSADVKYNYSLEQRAQWHRDVINDINNELGEKAPAYVCWYFDGGCRVTDSAGVEAVNESL